MTAQAAPIYLDPDIVRQGLSWAQSWSTGPILCVITPDAVRFTMASEHRFMASWEWRAPTAAPHSFFLFPPFVASTLINHSAYSITALYIRARGNKVALTMQDANGDYVLQWQWQAASFAAPPWFDLMSDPPAESLEEQSYMAIADAVHLAIANLGRLEAMEQLNRDSLAIAINFGADRFRIDGQPILPGEGSRYYFDPRLIMRGLEIVRSKKVSFSLAESPRPGQSILYMTGQRDNWTLNCAQLSIEPASVTEVASQRVQQVADSTRLIVRPSTRE